MYQGSSSLLLLYYRAAGSAVAGPHDGAVADLIPAGLLLLNAGLGLREERTLKSAQHNSANDYRHPINTRSCRAAIAGRFRVAQSSLESRRADARRCPP